MAKQPHSPTSSAGFPYTSPGPSMRPSRLAPLPPRQLHNLWGVLAPSALAPTHPRLDRYITWGIAAVVALGAWTVLAPLLVSGAIWK